MQGVVPNSAWDKINVSATTNAQATDWLKADLVLQYSTDLNTQPFKGVGGPLLGLLAWPAFDNAADWTTEDGHRRRVTTLSAASETDNPYFSVNNNYSESRTNRFNVNLGFTLLPVSWGNIQSKIGIDNYNTGLRVVRDPESSFAFTANGTLDESDIITRNLNLQNLLNFNRFRVNSDIGLSMLLGNSLSDESRMSGATGSDFLDPTFLSMNNTRNRNAINLITQRRRFSFFGQVQADYRTTCS
jgi:hypothetical protein